MVERFGWLDIEEVASALAREHPGVDPACVGVVRLRELVEDLEGFEEDRGHPAGDHILEAIRLRWSEVRGGRSGE